MKIVGGALPQPLFILSLLSLLFAVGVGIRDRRSAEDKQEQ